ncbi:MAG: HD domain-containing protein [Firmicutes bacterium]|nr:HD domain-containing protein [Bacillota bacterium]MCL5039669.1 HD domain-containing protein [Bacillota bacterium]
MSYKEYRDPLYGFIAVTELEQKIIDTRPFQRLRGVAQLGTTYLVYPTACHTRFEHSLGVMEVSTQLYNALISRPENLEILGWTKEQADENRRILRLAALLHDVGHAPFSHAAEDLFPEIAGRKLSHEDYTQKIISDTEIGEVLSQDRDLEFKTRIAEVATGTAKNKGEAFLSELITGDLGSDRMDYLIRDSFHLGVSYGRFDIHRLLNTVHLRLNEDREGPELVIEEGGTHSVEAFILARYFMFLEVYFHKTRRILDLHLSEFLSNVLENGTYPEDIELFLDSDDHEVFRLLHQHKFDPKARRLTNREHYRLAFETNEHPNPDEIERFDWLLKEVKSKYGEEIIRYDEATKAPYSYDEPPIFILWRDRYTPITKRSPLVKSLKKITKIRIYAPAENREDVRNFCQCFWDDREKRRGSSL